MWSRRRCRYGLGCTGCKFVVPPSVAVTMILALATPGVADTNHRKCVVHLLQLIQLTVQMQNVGRCSMSCCYWTAVFAHIHQEGIAHDINCRHIYESFCMAVVGVTGLSGQERQAERQPEGNAGASRQPASREEDQCRGKAGLVYMCRPQDMLPSAWMLTCRDRAVPECTHA